MTKHIVKTRLDINWVSGIEDKTKEEALSWIEEWIPTGAILEVDHGYDYSYGETYIHREETDAEYAKRLVEEAEAISKQELREIQAALTLQNKIAILRAQDLSLANYLEKHKDNPNIGDLENLYITLHQVMVQGSDNAVIQSLKECMEHLEN